MIARGDWLCVVSYPGEIHKNSNNSRKPNQNRKYFNPLVSGPGWFLDPDTMEKVLIRIQEKKVGEKTGGRKFRGTVPKYCSSILPRIEYKDTEIVYWYLAIMGKVMLLVT